MPDHAGSELVHHVSQCQNCPRGTLLQQVVELQGKVTATEWGTCTRDGPLPECGVRACAFRGLVVLLLGD